MAIDEAEPVRRSSGLTPQTRNVELTGKYKYCFESSLLFLQFMRGSNLYQSKVEASGRHNSLIEDCMICTIRLNTIKKS